MFYLSSHISVQVMPKKHKFKLNSELTSYRKVIYIFSIIILWIYNIYYYYNVMCIYIIYIVLYIINIWYGFFKEEKINKNQDIDSEKKRKCLHIWGTGSILGTKVHIQRMLSSWVAQWAGEHALHAGGSGSVLDNKQSSYTAGYCLKNKTYTFMFN